MLTRWKLNTNQKTEIITLFKQGWRVQHIAQKFEINHATVIYHIKKNHAQRIVPVITRAKPEKPVFCYTQRAWLDTDGSRMNEGKNYRDYVKEEARRKLSHAAIMLLKH